MEMFPYIQPLIAIILAPLLLGLINRTKAYFAGRTGQPLLQAYYDIAKLLRKGAVYSSTTSWIFRAAPVVCLAAAVTATLLVPFGTSKAPLAFQGDLILFAYLLGLMRFFIVIGALDTGSAFEGMGASREVQFSALAEPALLLGLAAMARQTHTWSLSEMYSRIWSATEMHAAITATSLPTYVPAMILVAAALLVIFLAENARIPVDDPNTHLELTMIHEVMVLDNSGPDFGFVLYAAALKLWVLGTLLVGILFPIRTGLWWADALAFVGGMMVLAVITGMVESAMARLRLVRVPQLLVAAGVLSTLALVLVLR
jgi:formate hydrogenlyase subunit 4